MHTTSWVRGTDVCVFRFKKIVIHWLLATLLLNFSPVWVLTHP